MKSKILSLCFTIFLGHILAAQSGVPGNSTAPTDAEVRKTTAALVLKYSLNADQAKQVYQIQQRNNRNMAQIEALRSSDIALYQAKWNNVQKGTMESLRRVLNNKSQVEIYQKTQSEIRKLRTAKRKELTVQKATKEVIESAVLAIYAE